MWSFLSSLLGLSWGEVAGTDSRASVTTNPIAGSAVACAIGVAGNASTLCANRVILTFGMEGRLASTGP
jgi:hypothetical protein